MMRNALALILLTLLPSTAHAGGPTESPSSAHRATRQEAPSTGTPDSAEKVTVDLAQYRLDLERRTEGGAWWRASNEAYRAQDGDGAADAYGMRWWLAPGGIAATGCLWRMRRGEAATIVWHFQQGWDGTRGQPFVYQAHASGTMTGFGHVLELDAEGGGLEQEFWWPDGSTSKGRHEDRWTDEDTRVTASFDDDGGEWVLNRTYTWERRRGGDVPCGPPEAAGVETIEGLHETLERDPRPAGFDPFIGAWDAPAELLERNPSLAEYFARTWSWGPHGSVVQLGESVHRHDPAKSVFTGLAFWDPADDRIEFVGYNALKRFAFEGHYAFGPGSLTRFYTVHYPSDFEHDVLPALPGRMREYRGELRIVEPDVVEQRTFMRVGREWVPWPSPDARPVRARRASAQPTRDPAAP